MEFIFGILLLIANIYAFIQVIGSGTSTGKKVLWILLIIFLPLIGFIAWLLAGPRSGHSAV